MSIELHVYSKEPILHRDKIATECLWPELPPDLRWEVRFISQSDELVTSGPLSDGLVVGWHPNSPHDSQIREVLATKRPESLDRLSSDNLLASLFLSVITPSDGESWKEVIESATEDAEQSKHMKYLRSVQTFYSLETSATRNDLSLEFQEQLWRMIGVLCEGLMYDPQESEFQLFEE